jgi:class 3 adenylate cyclase
MLCANCSSDNPADAAFCEQCGHKLELLCSACKSPVNPGARFCKKCGSSLSAAPVGSETIATSPSSQTGIRLLADQSAADMTGGERKTITALFADIKGSTELMAELDPEEARAVIDPALRLMIDAVNRYDGYVVQSTGDGIFALFGAPLAHEDHPQRALFSALRMQDELRRFSTRRVAEGGTPIQCRVGANTGEVVVRTISTGAGQTEYTPIGHTTNIAARMQAAAPVGSIAVSDATRRWCEGYFVFKSLGPTRLRGVQDLVEVHEVTGLGPLRSRFQRAAGRGLTKFVGRRREMEALMHAAEQAQMGQGQIVAVMADPGVGKSRLLYEFEATSRSWMVLETFSSSYGKASPYLPVIDLLRNYFDISSTDDERKRRDKVTGRVIALDRHLEDTLPYLFNLLGIVAGDHPLAQMDGQIRQQPTLDAIKRIILREALNQPITLIFEDLHWIDEQTQELLNLLGDSISRAKVLLLLSYRPEYFHQWNSKTYYTQLRLDPLGKESADEMLSALLGDNEDLISLKQFIIERTEGTPFFIEEIVQVLFEDGLLQHNGVIKLARSMNTLKVPGTVQAVLASRIDRLPAVAKELLQTLAVLGRRFPVELVRHVTLKPDAELDRTLSRLQTGEFIYEQPAAKTVEYTFKHALTQEVAYGALLIERRNSSTNVLDGRWSRCVPSSWTIIWKTWRIITAVATTRPRRSNIWGGPVSRRCSAAPMLMRSISLLPH